MKILLGGDQPSRRTMHHRHWGGCHQSISHRHRRSLPNDKMRRLFTEPLFSFSVFFLCSSSLPFSPSLWPAAMPQYGAAAKAVPLPSLCPSSSQVDPRPKINLISVLSSIRFPSDHSHRIVFMDSLDSCSSYPIASNSHCSSLICHKQKNQD